MGLTVKPTATPFIDMIDVALLKIACPERSLAELEAWVPAIKKACTFYGIVNLRPVACFIAQMAHESHLVPGRRENMKYTAKRMAEIWVRYAINPKAKPKDRLPNALVKRLAGDPVALANDVYANRMGNGDPKSGDGFRFRGTGPGQMTGRESWYLFGLSIGMSPEQAIAYALTVEGGAMSFGWFWSKNNLNKYAETPGVEDETKIINGGQHGLLDRRTRSNNTITEMLKRERERRK